MMNCFLQRQWLPLGSGQLMGLKSFPQRLSAATEHIKMREQFSGLCKMRWWHKSNNSVHRYLHLHANTGDLGFLCQENNSQCRETIYYQGFPDSSFLILTAEWTSFFQDMLQLYQNIYMLLKKRWETMHLSQKVIPTLGHRGAFLYVGPGYPKFSHTR